MLASAASAMWHEARFAAQAIHYRSTKIAALLLLHTLACGVVCCLSSQPAAYYTLTSWIVAPAAQPRPRVSRRRAATESGRRPARRAGSAAPIVAGARGGHRPRAGLVGAAHDLERPARLAAERQVLSPRSEQILSRIEFQQTHRITPIITSTQERLGACASLHGPWFRGLFGDFGAARARVGYDSRSTAARSASVAGIFRGDTSGVESDSSTPDIGDGSRRRRASRSARASRERCSSCFERK